MLNQQTERLSEGACDTIVEMAFVLLPAADGPELGAFLSVVFQVMEGELRRAVADERRRAHEMLTRVSCG